MAQHHVPGLSAAFFGPEAGHSNFMRFLLISKYLRCPTRRFLPKELCVPPAKAGERIPLLWNNIN